jgi:RimJ/RimL family protein N-acetyltransferase
MTAPENAASQRVAERAGFTREGLLQAWLPTSAGRRDSVMYSLLSDDPPANHLGWSATRREVPD